MWSYILKRLLLMIPTLLGVLLITFIVIQFVPGGPVEQMVAQLQGRDAGGGEAGGRAGAAPGPRYPRPPGVRAPEEGEVNKLLRVDQPPPRRFVPMPVPVARLHIRG